MTSYTQHELFDLAGAFALGATSPDETRAMEEAMASSPALAAEVLAHAQVVADMVASGQGVPPSADVRDRLIERVREEPGGHAAAQAARKPRRSVVPFAAAASVLIAAALGLQVARMQVEIGSVSKKLEHREATLNSLLHAENHLRVIHLKAADTVVGPGIQFFWDSRHRTGVIHAFRLPPASSGQAYQLWAVINDEPVSVRVFDSDPDGHALVEHIPLPPSTRGVSKLLVTVEPRGGSRAPTSVPLLGGGLSGE